MDYLADYRQRITFSDEKANKVVLCEAEHARTTLWCLQPGQSIKPHIHAGDHVWMVLEGEGNYLGDQGPQALQPGTVLTAPAGESHGVEAGSANLIFLSISAG